jgi:photosystem II stability/assembly factor-like uncharacterized protein
MPKAKRRTVEAHVEIRYTWPTSGFNGCPKVIMHRGDSALVTLRSGRLEYGLVLWLFLCWGARYPSAQVNTWTTDGPYGGVVTSLAIDPARPEVVYAGTHTRLLRGENSSGSLYRSQDGGLHWTKIGSSWDPVLALAIRPGAPSIVYAPLDGELARSTDGGAHWESSGQHLGLVRTLVITPSRPDTLYAGIHYQGVKKTTDGGTTWEWINSGLTDLRVYSLAVHHGNPDIVYAGTDGGGIFRSSDGGAHWTPANTGLAQPYVQSLALDAGNPAVLYLANLWGIWKTVDGGGHWTAISDGPARALATDPQQSGTVYASIGGEVCRSSNGGQSWTRIQSGLPDNGIDVLTADAPEPGVLYAGAGGRGVYRTSNGGVPWQWSGDGMADVAVTSLEAPALLPESILAATYGAGIWRTTDPAAGWLQVGGDDCLFVRDLAADPLDPETFFLVDGANVRWTTDGGAHWAAHYYWRSQDVAVDPSARGTAYAAADWGDVIRTTDEGSTWWGFGSGLPENRMNFLEAGPGMEGAVYLGTTDGLFRRTAGDDAWTPVDLPPASPSLSVTCIAFDSSDPAMRYLGTDGYGVLRSSDGGVHWEWLCNGLPSNAAVLALAVDPVDRRILFAATKGDGLFRSIDGGACWSAIGADLPREAILSLAAGPGAAGRLSVGLEQGGVFRITFSWDVDGDGQVSRSDRAALAEYLSESRPALPAGPAGADVDVDGRPTVRDLVWLEMNLARTDSAHRGRPATN